MEAMGSGELLSVWMEECGPRCRGSSTSCYVRENRVGMQTCEGPGEGWALTR